MRFRCDSSRSCQVGRLAASSHITIFAFWLLTARKLVTSIFVSEILSMFEFVQVMSDSRFRSRFAVTAMRFRLVAPLHHLSARYLELLPSLATQIIPLRYEPSSDWVRALLTR